jgi:hypothetical protein
MKILATLLFVALSTVASFAQSASGKYYELRIYHCLPGKLDALIDRFANHTTKLFEKHGMENVAYWVPLKNDANALYYIVAFPDKAARDNSWKTFVADPEWKEVAAKSEANGKIIEKITSVFMYGAGVLRDIKSDVSTPNRLFELRTYTCFPDKLPNLKTRFNDHTVKLFEKHGLETIGYWDTVEPDNAQSKLLYIVAHKDEAAATKSWESFRADPLWVKAKEKSEENGKLVEKVETIYLVPLIFSKIK